jgi:hypothetical protein
VAGERGFDNPGNGMGTNWRNRRHGAYPPKNKSGSTGTVSSSDSSHRPARTGMRSLCSSVGMASFVPHVGCHSLSDWFITIERGGQTSSIFLTGVGRRRQGPGTARCRYRGSIGVARRVEILYGGKMTRRKETATRWTGVAWWQDADHARGSKASAHARECAPLDWPDEEFPWNVRTQKRRELEAEWPTNTTEQQRDDRARAHIHDGGS